MTSRKVTQSDIARLAGVSQATVSLVLNGVRDGPRISDETRQRVMEAIRLTGYSANPMAQGLAGGRSRIIGVFTYEPVFPAGGADFYHPFLVGIEAAAEELGYDLLMFTSAPVQDGRRQLLREGWNRLRIAEGCLLLGRHDDKEELTQLARGGFPFVFIGRRESAKAEIPYVGADYETATREVVELLLDQGHTRIGFLGQLGPEESLIDRVRGYRAAMSGAGLRPWLLDQVDAGDADGVIDLVTESRLTAVVLGADYLAEDLRVAAERRGISVPERLSLAILGEPERPLPHAGRWTGFRIPREEMGAQALRLLSRLLGGEPSEDLDLHQLLPCPLVPGETVAPAAAPA